MPTAERKLVSLAGLNAGGCTAGASPLDGVVYTTLLTVLCSRRAREGSALDRSAPGGRRVVWTEWVTSLFQTFTSSSQLSFSAGLWVSSDGSSVDPSSDWNAPAEVWGNYEDPTSAAPPLPQKLLPEPTRVTLATGVAVSLPEQERLNVTAV